KSLNKNLGSEVELKLSLSSELAEMAGVEGFESIAVTSTAMNKKDGTMLITPSISVNSEIRAHGEPPTTYRCAEELGIRVIDATCPVVAQLQRKVVAAYAKMQQAGGQVVILGKRGHAEVVGLSGQVNDNVTVVESEDDLAQVDFSRPIFFLSQTTQSVALFWELAEKMKLRLEDEHMLTVDDTICRRVSNREKALSEFAQRFDVVIFVCGKKSSNGKVLFDVCHRANSRAYNIEEESELQPEWFEGCHSAGICGATSTPTWLMQRVAEAIEKRFM
ncbi:MAG: hypothetical protein J6V27_05115, partial [Alistipes sp.]|nr:hypothetical protein [Alistipes sp.]